MNEQTPARYARIWRGRTPKEKADAYERYWLANGVTPLRQKGAVAVQMLREDREADTEFVTISYWESLAAMGAGPDPRRTHHLEHDPEFLIEVPEFVQILSLLETHGSPG